MAQVRWTERALAWLQEIHDHIATDNPEAAQRVVLGIYRRIETLKQHPELGHRYTTRSGASVRPLIYGRYRIAYRLVGDRDAQILGIYHGSLALDRHLD